MAMDDTASNRTSSEKHQGSSHHEHAITLQEGIEIEFDDVETSKVLRKVDWRLLPVLSFLYLLAFLDREYRCVAGDSFLQVSKFWLIRS